MKVFKKLFTYFSVTAMSFMMFGNVAMADVEPSPAFIVSVNGQNTFGPNFNFGKVSPGDSFTETFVVSNLDLERSIFVRNKTTFPEGHIFENWVEIEGGDVLTKIDPLSSHEFEFNFSVPADVVYELNNDDLYTSNAAIIEVLCPQDDCLLAGGLWSTVMENYTGKDDSNSIVSIYMAIGQYVFADLSSLTTETDHDNDEDNSKSHNKYIDWENMKLERKYPFDIKDLTKPKYELKDYMIPKDDKEEESEEESSEDDNNKEKKSERRMSYKKAYKSKYRR